MCGLFYVISKHKCQRLYDWMVWARTHHHNQCCSEQVITDIFSKTSLLPWRPFYTLQYHSVVAAARKSQKFQRTRWQTHMSPCHIGQKPCCLSVVDLDCALVVCCHVIIMTVCIITHSFNNRFWKRNLTTHHLVSTDTTLVVLAYKSLLIYLEEVVKRTISIL